MDRSGVEGVGLGMCGFNGCYIFFYGNKCCVDVWNIVFFVLWGGVWWCEFYLVVFLFKRCVGFFRVCIIVFNVMRLFVIIDIWFLGEFVVYDFNDVWLLIVIILV